VNTIERSVVVAVPLAEADREWARFTLRTLVGNHRIVSPEEEWSLRPDLDREARVRFTAVDLEHTRVSVIVENRSDPAAGVAILERLRRDLEEYRAFVETRQSA